jgi:DNA-binding PadR family transcriptional regulator
MCNSDISNMHPSHPLKPAVFYILLALMDGDRHGYAVMQDVRERSGGRLAMYSGSFYRHLLGLMDAGLVMEVSGSGNAKDKDPRRGVSYRLTAQGKRAIEAERERLEELLRGFGPLRPAARKGRS